MLAGELVKLNSEDGKGLLEREGASNNNASWARLAAQAVGVTKCNASD